MEVKIKSLHKIVEEMGNNFPRTTRITELNSSSRSRRKGIRGVKNFDPGWSQRQRPKTPYLSLLVTIIETNRSRGLLFQFELPTVTK